MAMDSVLHIVIDSVNPVRAVLKFADTILQLGIDNR